MKYLRIRQWKYVQELYAYRELFYFLIWRELKVRYKQTLIGWSWTFIQPFLTMVVFSFVFGTLLALPSNNIPYPIFLYTGLIYWNFFARAVTSSMDSLTGNHMLIRNVYFPKIILPMISVFVNIVDFISSLVILFFLIILFGVRIHIEGLFIIPLALVNIIFLSMGIGAILSVLNAAYRDIRFIVPYVLQVLLFLTPIIYPQKLAQQYSSLLLLNPLAGCVEIVREFLFGAPFTHMEGFIISFAISGVILIVGVLFFEIKEKKIIDRI